MLALRRCSAVSELLLELWGSSLKMVALRLLEVLLLLLDVDLEHGCFLPFLLVE